MNTARNAAGEDRTYLWSIMPPRVKHIAVPVVTTSFLVGAGKEIAELLTRMFGGAVQDVNAVLLLLALAVNVWGLYGIVNLRQPDGAATADASAWLAHFFGVFAPIANLFKLAVSYGRLEWLVYPVFVVVIFIIAPWTIALIRDEGAGTSERGNWALHHLVSLVTRSAYYSIRAALFVALFCLLWFVVLNYGVPLSSVRLVRAFVPDVRCMHRVSEYWMINPSVALPLLVLEVCAVMYRSVVGTPPVGCTYGRSTGWQVGVVAGLAVLNVLAAPVLISSESIGYVFPDPPSQPSLSTSLQAVGAALIYVVAFFGAFCLTRVRLLHQRGAEAGFLGLGSLTATRVIVLFAVAGLVAGAGLYRLRAAVRATLGYDAAGHVDLIWMHGVGFALGALALVLSGRLIARRERGRVQRRPDERVQ